MKKFVSFSLFLGVLLLVPPLAIPFLRSILLILWNRFIEVVSIMYSRLCCYYKRIVFQMNLMCTLLSDCLAVALLVLFLAPMKELYEYVTLRRAQKYVDIPTGTESGQSG